MMDRPIRVLFLTHNYPRYDGDASGVFLRVLARSLTRHGVQPVILAPHDTGLTDREEQDGVLTIRFRYDFDEQETLAYRGNMHQIALGSPAGFLRFNRFLAEFEKSAKAVIEHEQIDLIWGHWLVPAGVVMRRIMRRTNLPMILSSHGTDIRLLSKFGFLARQYFNPLAGRIHAWTVVSQFLKHQITAIIPDHAAKLTVIPLPHDETIFYRDDRIVREPDRIVAITRFTEQKRVGQLVDAFSKVSARHSGASLHIWGSGPLQARTEDQIRSLGLSSRIKIHSPVAQKELAGVYRTAGMVVLNSVDEGFGLALSEAMLCGTPVIGVRSGGITDIITDSTTGLLARPDDPSDLADKMALLLADSALRATLAESGQEAAKARYASALVSAEYVRLIRAACGR